MDGGGSRYDGGDQNWGSRSAAPQDRRKHQTGGNADFESKAFSNFSFSLQLELFFTLFNSLRQFWRCVKVPNLWFSRMTDWYIDIPASVRQHQAHQGEFRRSAQRDALHEHRIFRCWNLWRQQRVGLQALQVHISKFKSLIFFILQFLSTKVIVFFYVYQLNFWDIHSFDT